MDRHKTLYFCSPSAHPCIAPAQQNRTHAVNHVEVFHFYPRSLLQIFFFLIACHVSTLWPFLLSLTKEIHICPGLVNEDTSTHLASWLTHASRGSGSGFLEKSSGRESGRTPLSRHARRHSPVGAEFREVFKDGFIHRIKVIFLTLISSPVLISKYHLAHSCAVSTFYLKKINTSSPHPFPQLLPLPSPGQIGVLLFNVRCPESSASFGMWKIWRHG